MKKYELISLDCLHDGDSWSVNDARFTGIIIELNDDATDKQIKTELIKSGYASKHLNRYKLDIHGESDFSIYIDHIARSVDYMKPFCELRCIKEEG